VAIRITTTVDDRHTILKIDGRLEAEDVAELTQACHSVEGATALDLSELRWADREGMAVLRELVLLGAEIHRASPYIALLLKSKP